MKDAVVLKGVVLIAQPVKDYDKRLVILTAERGLVTAFVRGARRQNSPLLAATNPFVFGYFSLYEGRNAYTLVNVKAEDFFENLPYHMPGVYYGFYFLELSSYFSREEQEAEETVNLIYVALKAILKEKIPLVLVRSIFELRLLKENGLYAPPEEKGNLDESAYYALCFVSQCSVQKLFSFTLSEDAMKDFQREVRKCLNREVDRPMKSLALIDEDN